MGLGRSAEQNRCLGGDIRLKSGPYLVLFVLLHGGRPGSGRPRTFFLENILPQERYQLVSDLYLQFLPCATQMHTRRYGSLPAPSSIGGHRSMHTRRYGSLPAPSSIGGHRSQEVFEGL